VLTLLNVTTHDFLVLLKEATRTTIIPSPTVEHSLSEVLHKINGSSSSDDRGQEDGSSTTMNAARAAAAAVANIIVNEQLALGDFLFFCIHEVLAPLNVTTHDFLVLLKEATGTTIIPSPTVEHSLSEVLHKINGSSSSDDRGQEDGSSTTMNAACAAAAAAANIIVNEQLALGDFLLIVASTRCSPPSTSPPTTSLYYSRKPRGRRSSPPPPSSTLYQRCSIRSTVRHPRMTGGRRTGVQRQ
jgi:hypothetical protein